MKLIIQNESRLDMANAMMRCLKVVESGLVSKTSLGTQYCFVTTFADKTVVYGFRNRKSQRLVVCNDSRK